MLEWWMWLIIGLLLWMKISESYIIGLLLWISWIFIMLWMCPWIIPTIR